MSVLHVMSLLLSFPYITTTTNVPSASPLLLPAHFLLAATSICTLKMLNWNYNIVPVIIIIVITIVAYGCFNSSILLVEKKTATDHE